jgi:2-oxoglutarate ferredoxin oxidoreductase subunit gamma
MTADGLYEEVIIAGFGGQGIMLAGKLLAQTAMRAGKEVTYMSSYGAEVRGGTANCMVVIAEKKIACPVVSKPDSLIVMNKASLNKFGPCLKAGGLLVMNSSLIDSEPQLDNSVQVIAVPADELAVVRQSAERQYGGPGCVFAEAGIPHPGCSGTSAAGRARRTIP